MSMTIKAVTSFLFSSQQGETIYNLTIPARSEPEAREKLIRDLTLIIEEIKANGKTGPN